MVDGAAGEAGGGVGVFAVAAAAAAVGAGGGSGESWGAVRGKCWRKCENRQD